MRAVTGAGAMDRLEYISCRKELSDFEYEKWSQLGIFFGPKLQNERAIYSIYCEHNRSASLVIRLLMGGIWCKLSPL